MTTSPTDTRRAASHCRAVDVLPAINPDTVPFMQADGSVVTFRIDDVRFSGLTPKQEERIAEGIQQVVEELAAEFAARRKSHPGDPAHTSRTVSVTGPVQEDGES